MDVDDDFWGKSGTVTSRLGAQALGGLPNGAAPMFPPMPPPMLPGAVAPQVPASSASWAGGALGGVHPPGGLPSGVSPLLPPMPPLMPPPMLPGAMAPQVATGLNPIGLSREAAAAQALAQAQAVANGSAPPPPSGVFDYSNPALTFRTENMGMDMRMHLAEERLVEVAESLGLGSTLGLESPDAYFGAADRRNMRNTSLSHQQKCEAWAQNDRRKRSVNNLFTSMPEYKDDPAKRRKFMEALHIQSGFGADDPVVALAEKMAEKKLAKALKEPDRPKRPWAGGVTDSARSAGGGGGDAAKIAALEAKLAETAARAAALESLGPRGGGKGAGGPNTNSFASGTTGCFWCGSFDHKMTDISGAVHCPAKLAGKPKKV